MQKVSELPYVRVKQENVVAAIKEQTQKIAQAKSGKELVQIREQCLRHVFTLATMNSLAFIRFTCNTRDEFYLAEKDYYDEALPAVDAELVKFKQAFLNSPYRQEAEQYISPLVCRQYEVEVRCNSDQAVPYKVQENKIVTEYTKLMAETLFEFKGEKLPLSALRKYFTDPDRNVRKEAYTVLGQTLATIGDKLDDIYDRLVKVRTDLAHVLGYENFVALGDNLLGRISFDRNMLHTFRNNVKKDIVPVVTQLKKQLRSTLHIDKFMLYDNDTYFPEGNPVPVLTAQEMFDASKEMYCNMSKDTGEFFDSMLASDAFDVFPREGKWGGGYCDALIDFAQPFILANFNGSADDVNTLTHEAGHAFAFYMSFKQHHDQGISLGMETAETHSMSMEFFCHKYMDKFFGERANEHKYAHLFDAITFLPYGTIVDYFQEEVYTHPEWTPAQRNAFWKKLESEFRPWLTADGIPYLENGTRWQYQMHIFESPLYYIDYCLAQSVALQFFAKSIDDYDGAFAAYIALVNKGATEQFPRLIADAGLRSPFENGALSGIAQTTKKILQNK